MAKFPARLPRSREPSQPALSYEHIENFTRDLEVRRDLANRASPVNRAHMKRPLVVQNSVVVVQNNGKGKTKKRAARANLFFAN